MTGISDSTSAFLARIRRRNSALSSRDYLHSRFILRYCVTYCVFFLIGIGLFYLFDMPVTEKITSSLLSCFSLFCGEGGTSFMADTAALSLADARQAVVMALAGCTFFAGAAMFTITALRGAAFGFSVGCLITAARSGIITVSRPTAAFLLFVVANAAVTVILIWLSATCRLFCDKISSVRTCRSFSVRLKTGISYLISLAVACGAVFAVTALFLFMFRIMQK